jgi:hypothetical protein
MTEPGAEYDRALVATEDAQRVLRGEAAPRPEIVFQSGCTIDTVSGVLYCPDCGQNRLRLIEALSHPAGGSPSSAGIFLRCLDCSTSFCLSVDHEQDGICVLSTARLRA